MTAASSSCLTLGPLLFNWPAEQARDFYFRIADEASVDIVHLGEVVCSKRVAFQGLYLTEVAERLNRAGKQVVFSTLALIMSEREMDGVRAIAAMLGVTVEANDIAAADLLAGRPHVIGPFVNVYNEGTLAFLAARGAIRVALPGELQGPAVAALARGVPGTEVEVQAFGRLPLALSARCYHARARGLHKDGCQYVCADDPDGMTVETIDRQPFLAVNGIQTLSYTVCNLIAELPEMTAAGVRHLRLWPHAVDMVAVAEVFREVLDGHEGTAAGSARLAGLVGVAPFSNGYYHGREGVAWSPPDGAAAC